MKHILIKHELPLVTPGVEVTVKGRRVTVTGPKGTVNSDFSHASCKLKIVSTQSGKKLVVSMMNATRKEGATVRSIITTVKKMIVGVNQGYRYKMRLVYAHFPINVSIVNTEMKDGVEMGKRIEVRNFVGQKEVFCSDMMGESWVRMGEMRDEIYVEGIDLRDVSQSASRIHLSCRVKKKDIRKFLDGVYVWAKGPMDEEVPV